MNPHFQLAQDVVWQHRFARRVAILRWKERLRLACDLVVLAAVLWACSWVVR